jgi:hypothetical protein
VVFQLSQENIYYTETETHPSRKILHYVITLSFDFSLGAIHTPGCCGACQCELIKYFLVAYDEEDISHQCGHGVCRNCYTRLTADQNSDYLFLCPVCRRQVQMFVEAQF